MIVEKYQREKKHPHTNYLQKLKFRTSHSSLEMFFVCHFKGKKLYTSTDINFQEYFFLCVNFKLY